MSEIKFDLNAWKEANELINEQLTEYLTKKNLCEQWKYLMDEESTFGFFDPDSSLTAVSKETDPVIHFHRQAFLHTSTKDRTFSELH